MRLSDYLGDKNVVVVAHPDDESLWAGGLLSNYGHFFDVICCTIPRREPERAQKFLDVARFLKFRPVLIPHQEPESPRHPIGHLALVDVTGYDLVVTHNKKGEYGHPHHMQVHRHVREHAEGKVLNFGYGVGGEPLMLENGAAARKLEAIKMYDHESAVAGVPKHEELMKRYYPAGLGVETYVVLNDSG